MSTKTLRSTSWVARGIPTKRLSKVGSDFDGISGMAPRGMEDVSKYPVLVKGLIDMGYNDTDIRKIMGLNLVRVMRENERKAAQ